MAEVIERECPRSGSPNCPKLLEEQAREILQVGRGHVRTTLSVLTRLAKRLESVHGSKHVILLSGGKAFDQDLLPDYREFARQSAASGLVVHSIHLDAPADDATVRRRTGSAFGGRDMATGLTTISGLTGGAYYSAVARATGVFDRIRTEISSFYELGVESTAADADGRAHDIDVKVNRPGVRVRARQQVMVPAATAADAKATPADPLIALLQRQAVDVAEVPIALATYTTRGTEPTMLKVMLSAEMGGPQTRAPAEWAYVIFDKDEKLAADGRQTIDEAGSGPWAVTTSAQLAPGRYRIRFAAIDAEGREGVLDRPLRIGLRAAGGLQMSDLIVGTAAGGRLQARSRVAQGERLSALLELMTADTALLGRSRAAFELIPAGTAEPALRVLMAARTSGSDAVLLNGADIDTTTLAPGRYTASAVALVDGRPVGRVSRVIDVVAR
jgi:hypothetical protein